MSDWDDKTKVADTGKVDSRVEDRDRAYLIVLAGTNVGEMFKLSREATTIGRGQQADIQIIDEGISRRHARLVADNEAVYVEDLGSTNGTFVNGQKVAREPLHDGDKIQVGSTTILKFSYHDELEEEFQRQMYESALRDGLTKIFNKKYFLDRLEGEFAYAARHRVALSLVMFDIDHFKQINDTYGHLAGDQVLVALARKVSDSIRAEDVFARYGGEEFIVICRGIEVQAAHAFADRLRRTIEGFPFAFNGVPLRVTISIGVAALPNPAISDPIAFIGVADEAMYEAKRAGRNRVIVRKP
jgi:diguanylate cyclase (GGDEF)-like protein